MHKPKLGAVFLAGDSWWESGVCEATKGPYAGFLDAVQSDVERARATLAETCAVVSPGLLHTEAEVAAETRRLAEARVDAIVLCPIIWTNDQPVITFLREAPDVPLLLWAYDPYGGFLEYFALPGWLRASGAVSVQQCSNILRRFGRHFEVVHGNEKDTQTRRELAAFGRAAAVRKSLEGARIAVLPAPCRVVMGSWVDDFHLLERFGVELVYVSAESYVERVKAVSDADATAYGEWLRGRCRFEGVEEAQLLRSAKEAIAMARLAEDERLCGIALEDFHEAFYRLLGARPHLYHPRLGELGCTVGLEADVPNVLATVLLARLAGRPAMFNELFNVDGHANAVLMGHPGMGEPALGDPDSYLVTPDLEIDESQPRGVWWSYRAKPGPMTFLNLTPEYGRLKAAVWQGAAMAGQRMMEGYAHMLVTPEHDARDMFKRIVKLGLLQHWGTVHGDLRAELRCLAGMYGLDLVEL